MIDSALTLNSEQEKAFEALQKAFENCGKVGVQIYGELNTLYALNGNHMRGKKVDATGDRSGAFSVSENAAFIAPKCFKGCFADDGVSIVRVCD